MAKKCRRGQHRDRVVRGGRRLRCTECGDEFPCRHNCDHVDCAEARTDYEFALACSEWGAANLPEE
jgi:hypothetical protein